MLTINKSQVTLAAGSDWLVTEASSIGLAPGEWPDFIAVVDDAGSGFLFGPTKHYDGEAMVYHSQTAATLAVLND